ncbi:MAG: tetratricopeptide repeat protein [Pontiellaceae bacterium]|nr:tetratricopeptide repeat protein [Pontiellaceae bacterium]MBN2783420.1 tetratricopeptide repeat protein [Pontiellaceae bacterium]
MRISSYYLMSFLAVLVSAAFVQTAPAEESPYVLVEKGRGTWRSMFDRKMETPEQQWTYARETQNQGRLRKADRRMLYLVRRWPNSKEAPLAARARGDILLAQGDLDDAFQAYQFLIDNYSSRMAEYDAVLESQYNIAVKVMNRRRMRLFFGGFRAPEYAVKYLEQIIRNGPQWGRAPEVQYLIGQCQQDAKEYELAISAYSLLGYRYPDSRFAEDAAWNQLQCLNLLREEYPNSPEMLDRTLTASTVFLDTYPDSRYNPDIITLRNSLYEVRASALFETAGFYARVPKKPDAAILYDKAVISEYPLSERIPDAKERISELEELLNKPEEDDPVVPHSKPLPFG